MKIELTEEETSALIAKTRRDQFLPLSFGPGWVKLNADDPNASWAVAELEVMRAKENLGPAQPYQPKHETFPYGNEMCQCQQSANFMCTQCQRGDYSFPDYGRRLERDDIAALLLPVLDQAQALTVADHIDRNAYVHREC